MIPDEYTELLTALGIRFTTNNGLTVWINNLMISVSAYGTGIVSLSSYIGIVDYGQRNADRLVKKLLAAFPGYQIFPDRYSCYYEIEVEQDFSYTTSTALQEAVVAMAEVLEEGFLIGTEMLGTEVFHR